jgi:hypothetical protein
MSDERFAISRTIDINPYRCDGGRTPQMDDSVPRSVPSSTTSRMHSVTCGRFVTQEMALEVPISL